MTNHTGTVVLYPSPAIGHLISMVELGKFILKHHPSLSITILITTPPYNTGSTAPYIARVSKTTPSIHFHHLPTVSLPPTTSSHMETLAFELLHLNNPLVHQALLALSQSSTIRSFIIDGFCTPALQVSIGLNIPTFYFYTSGISVLAHLLYFPTFNNNPNTHTQLLNFPGLPPITMSDMPKPMVDKSDKAFQFILNVANDMTKSSGIIVNSFESFEPRALRALRDDLCIPNSPTPPVFCIGPLIADDGSKADGDNVHQCLSWLDSQPTQTVVFLCFGSLGWFSKSQLHEMAMGLENSGVRFLWVVRSPPSDDNGQQLSATAESDLPELLPPGFLERTEKRGLVVKSWVPQVEVLSHDSVGGFVTHCGWNSVLESVWAGVPMLAWPLYAEQRINKVILAEEMGIALGLDESENGCVSGSELEKRVRELMESEEGNVIRERVRKMSGDAKGAMSKGGSSVRALNEFVMSWKVSHR